MFKEMLQVMATVPGLIDLTVASTHVATHHSSMISIRSNSLDINTQQYH